MASEEKQPGETSTVAGERQLCLNCLTPNEVWSNFCSDCGAPLSSYAATGPFEHLFAEGHVYRKAAEQPRRLIVVLGVWFIFGLMAIAAAFAVWLCDADPMSIAGGVAIIPISIAMIWRTTRNYFRKTSPSPVAE